MKRSIFRFFHILFLALTFSACVDINEDLTGQPTTDKFFLTSADFRSFLNGAYIPLIKIYGTDCPYIATAGGEDVTTSITRWKGFAEINIIEVSNSDEVTNVLFEGYYSSISSCNTLLDVIRRNTLIAAVELNPIEGEARFLRAFSYFCMVRNFGELPLITEDNQANAADEPQSSVADIYDLIIKDLKIAETLLPLTQPNAGRPSQWAAKALLAKAYLYTAGYPLKITANYALARDKAFEVIEKEEEVYRLEPEFAQLWRWQNRYTNREFIFSLYASADNGTGGYINRSVRPEDGNEGGWADWTSDSTFLKTFPVGDGNRLNGSFYLKMRDGKPWQATRLKQPYVGKLRDGGVRSGGYDGIPLANIADGFYCMLRYADVLLIYAEAANNAEGSPSVLAYAAVDKVRKRAGLLPLPSNLTAVTFDQAVLDERNWEFAFECNRWYDLCRRELFTKAYPDITVEEYKFLLPKPYGQLRIMKGLRQNPEY